MVKLKIIIFCIAVSITTICLASVSSSVSSTKIYLDEPFQFTITTDQPDQPNLTPLYKSFNILGQSSGQQMIYVNGNLSRSYQYTYSLTVKRNIVDLSKGSIGVILPSILFGKQETRAIQLTVQKPVNTISSDDNIETKIEISVNPENSFVQQEIILNVDIYLDEKTASLIQSMSMSPIEIQNTIIREFKHPTIYKKMIDGKQIVIVVKKLALFPQNSGEITIPPVTFTATILNDNKSQQQLGMFNSPFFTYSKKIRVTSNSMKIKIKPIPDAVVGAWLPTTSLSIEDHFDPIQNEYRVGEIITRTISIEADGLVAEQLPEIKPTDIDNVNIYQDTPKLQNFESKGSIHSKRIETFTYIPIKKGSFTIPEIKLQWYDIFSKVAKTITLPAKTIMVLPALNTANNADINTLNNQIDIPLKTTTTSKIFNLNNYFFIIIIIFALLFSYIAIYFYLRTKSVKSNKQNIFPIKKMNINTSLCLLEKKFKHNKPEKIKQAYNDFLNGLTSQQLTLKEIMDGYSDKTKNLLADLDVTIYGNKDIPVDGKKIFNSIKLDINKVLQEKRRKVKLHKNDLPNLYPD